MKITDVPSAVLRLQYQVVRYPLQVIEDQVITRLDPEAPGRLLYERSFGKLDATVGNVLDDPELEERGNALAERSDALSRAARLDAAATQKEMHADADFQAKRQQAVEDQKEARAAKAQAVEDARSTAADRKAAAVDTAEKRSAAAKNQADGMTANRIGSIEAALREEQAEIRAAEQAAVAAADSKLEDAQAKRASAAGTRALADREERLAHIEKQKRRSARGDKT